MCRKVSGREQTHQPARYNILPIQIPQEGRTMTRSDIERIMELCQLICQEHDARKFHKLVVELNELLKAKGQALKKPPDPAN